MSECPKVAYIVFLSSCLRLSGSHYSLAVTLAAAATNVRHLYLRLVLTRGVISLSLSPASAYLSSGQVCCARGETVSICVILFLRNSLYGNMFFNTSSLVKTVLC